VAQKGVYGVGSSWPFGDRTSRVTSRRDGSNRPSDRRNGGGRRVVVWCGDDDEDAAPAAQPVETVTQPAAEQETGQDDRDDKDDDRDDQDDQDND